MNNWEIAHQNARRLPIPATVINDAVRNFEVTDKATFFTFKNGEYEYLLFAGTEADQLRERERKEKAGFKAWVEKNGLVIPEPFRENNEDLRFLVAHQHDFQSAYDGMLENEKWLLEFQAPLFERFEEL